jgi:hypothetical protein
MAKVSDNPKVSENPKVSNNPSGAGPDDDQAAMRRARWLMLISAATTAIALAAVIGVIGYRLYSAESGEAGLITHGTIFLPKGGRVVSTAVSGGRIVVTLDVAGATEIRTFDVKTLRETGRIGFAAPP